MKKILSIFLSLSMILSSVSQNICLADTAAKFELTGDNLIFDQPKKLNVTENLINKNKETFKTTRDFISQKGKKALKSTRDFISQKCKKALKSTEDFISENSLTIIVAIALATLSALPTINGVKNFSKIKELLADRTISIGSKFANLTKILFNVKDIFAKTPNTENVDQQNGNSPANNETSTDLVNKNFDKNDGFEKTANETGTTIEPVVSQADENDNKENDSQETQNIEEPDIKHLELPNETSSESNEIYLKSAVSQTDKNDDFVNLNGNDSETSNEIEPTTNKTTENLNNTLPKSFIKDDENTIESVVKQTKEIDEKTKFDDTNTLPIPEFTPIPTNELSRKWSILDYITATIFTLSPIIGTVLCLHCRSKFTPSLNKEISASTTSNLVHTQPAEQQNNYFLSQAENIINTLPQGNYKDVGGIKNFKEMLLNTIKNGLTNGETASDLIVSLNSCFSKVGSITSKVNAELTKLINDKFAD